MRMPSIRSSRSIAVLVCLALSAAACGEAPSSASPSARPTPVVTPDPHLGASTTVDDVWRGLGSAGVRLTANNASAGVPGDDLVKRINATYLGWPLNVSEFRTRAALVRATDWKPGVRPGQGEAPVAIAGANILVTWGPQTGATPAAPDGRQLEGLDELVTALDGLLAPLRVRSVVAIDVPGVAGDPPAASSSATADEGEATPAP
jgi:hypothetical protein